MGWHRLVMSSIFMDSSYKKQLAIALARNYLQLEKNFVADSHDHDVCVSVCVCECVYVCVRVCVCVLASNDQL